MVLSEKIARMIEQMLEEQDGILEIGRNDLATQVGCVPSQINYVITSRFTPQRGYLVESRRGGGGYVRLTKVKFDKSTYLMHFYHAVGTELDYTSAKVFTVQLAAKGILTAREAALLNAALHPDALSPAPRATHDALRAQLLKRVILTLIGS